MFEATQPIVKFINTIALIVACLLLPIMVPGLLWGLAGDTPHYVALIGIGYLGVIVFGSITGNRPKFFIATLASIALIVTGHIWDTKYWDRHNSEVCTKIRVSPNCKELEHGFTCELADDTTAHYPKSICD
ncbi:hypothetical protein AB3Y13_21145 [Vibrio alginolyticus]|uniref:hypothetical protein n=1 Tax=Vibrio rotiferianus TaxID=190895 RepID=UPI001110F94B|nr:hypothetical protein [Vibrio rotiferianus]TMX71158.1 hypothetical protein DA097_03980 [Vibrio rotiferianus]